MQHSTNSFNRHFTHSINFKLAGLFKYEPEHDRVFIKGKRKSCLDPHLPEILKNRDKGWSYQRIADYLNNRLGCEGINKSTVMRRINKFNKEA